MHRRISLSIRNIKSMQDSGNKFCSFCKRSASQLVPHSLCHCCLVNLKRCDPSIEEPNLVVPKETAVRKVECDVCFEEFQEDSLAQHRMVCMPRWIFRCSVCDGDYLSKEGLWNHLALHEIADIRKESHCQERRATYEFQNCVLCNDQRCYQHNAYWKHVHEDHDGFFLRCSECGENFRSVKLKSEHRLNHYKITEQPVASESTELDVDHVYGITTAGKQLSSKSQVKPPEENIESSEANQADQQNTLGSNNEADLAMDCDGSDDEIDELTNDGEENDEEEAEECLEDESGKSSVVRCPHCNKKYPSVRALGMHIRYRHRPATCDVCGLFFSNGNKARYHKRRKHATTSYKCPDCPKEFAVEGEYRRHLTTHQTEREFLCTKCASTFKTAVALNKHTKDVHTRFEKLRINGSNGGDIKKQKQRKRKAGCPVKIDCPICQENFNDRNEMSQHVQETHELHICTGCKATFSKAGVLAEHKCTTCADCGEECLNHAQLESHIKLCHELVKCDICGTSIPGESQLILHKSMLHGESRYKCPHCVKNFCLKVQYERHMGKHTDVKQFKCEHCERRFKTIPYVMTHLQKIHQVKKTRKDLVKYFKSQGIVLSTERQVSNGQNVSSEQRTSNEKRVSNEQLDGVVVKLESIVEVGETMFLKPEYPSESSSSIEKVAYDRNSEVNNQLPENPAESMSPIESVTDTNKATKRTLKAKFPVLPKFKIRRKRRQTASQVIGNVNPSVKPSDTVCPHCGKECNRKSRLISHLTWTHDLIECDTCGETCNGKHHLRYHKLIVHTEPKLHCPKCPMKFHIKHSYEKHVSLHDKYSEVHTCTTCNRNFVTLNELNKHIKNVHLIRKDQTDYIVQSDEQQRIQQARKISIKQEAPEEPPSPTTVNNNEDTTESTSSEALAKCPHCDKSFRKESFLERHIKANHFATSCEICGQKFENKNRVGYHKRTVHRDPKYKCPHCQETFYSKLNFERHVEHHGTNRFPCQFCTLSFRKAISLSLHVAQSHRMKKLK